MFFRTRARSFLCSGICRALRAFFFARRRATRSGSVALAALRSALDKWASFGPRSGLPLGTVVGVGFVDVRVIREGAPEEVRVRESRGALGDLGKVLQRSTRSLRLANLSFLGSRASISSTHSRSYLRVGIISLVNYVWSERRR